MSEEKIEEETYSLIFKSLKHPIRRKILRILVDKQLAFSKILDILSIDSGHLSYHLENLGGLIKRSANGKYGLSSIGIAAVDLMSGVEERPQMLTLTGKFRSKKIRNVLMGVVLAILIMSAAFNIYYYSLSQELNGKFYNSKGALSGVATAFDHSLHYAILILESEPTPENLYDLVMYFRYHIQSAMVLIDAFQWLLPSYKDSFRIIKSSLLDIVLGPKEGPAGGVEWVLTALNVSMAIDAFKELRNVTSGKLLDIGNELLSALDFHMIISNGLRVENFRIIPSKIENAALLANDFKTILKEWFDKYSQI